MKIWAAAMQEYGIDWQGKNSLNSSDGEKNILTSVSADYPAKVENNF